MIKNLSQLRGAVILAGGRSTRMGENKALVTLMGESLLSLEVNSLSSLVDEVMVIAKTAEEMKLYEKEVPSNVKLLFDAVSQDGPLVGIYSALKVTKSEYCYVHPVDSPIINAKVVNHLFDMAMNYDGAVIKLERDLVEPLHAVYKRNTALVAAEKALQLGDSSAKILCKETRVKQVPLDDIRVFDNELVSLFNINTKNDLKTIENYLHK